MSVASKNLYELLGNDDEGDDTPPTLPRIVDKKTPGTKKVGPVETPTQSGPTRRGNDAAFHDRNAGRESNRSRPLEESGSRGRGGGRGARVRGGRGSGNPRPYDDRRAKNIPHGSEKQAAHGWGATEGEAELKDEQAGEQIAAAEQGEAAAEGEDKAAEGEAAEDAEPAEPEVKQTTLDDYKAELAEKQAQLGTHQIRQANEGSKLDKKFADLKPFSREEDEFMAGTGGKHKRERERKVKEMIPIDDRYHEPERRPMRGGRGGGGDRGGRGEYRGNRGRGGSDAPRGRGGSDAPRGTGRGGPRGGAGPRGPRRDEPPKADDPEAFPSLGA
jgi:plasminogen activator inhibitor 1 RNA-binding protein